MMPRRLSVILVVVLAALSGVPLLGCGMDVSRSSIESAQTTQPAVQSGIDFGSPGMPMIPGRVTMSDAVKSYAPPASMPLYEVKVEKPLSRESMEELARALVIGDPVVWGAQGFSTAEYAVDFPRGDEASCFTLTKKTGIDKYVQMVDQGTGVPACPTEAEAIKIADARFAALGYGGLERTGVEVQDSIISSRMGAADVRYDLTRVVSYQTRLDALPLLGPGAKISVTIGPGGEVLRMKHWVVPTTKGPEVKLRSVSLAAEDIAAGKGSPPVRMDSMSVKTVNVTGISLAYWAEPTPLKKAYYKPVYVFRVVGADGSTGDWMVEAFEKAAAVE